MKSNKKDKFTKFQRAVVRFVAFLFGLFSVLLIVFGVIGIHDNADLSYDDVTYQKLHLKDYQRVNVYKASDYYELYFVEVDGAFRLDSYGVSSKQLHAYVQSLYYNTEVELYYIANSSQSDYYDICQITFNSTTLFTLDEYANDKVVVNVIFVSSGATMGAFTVWIVLCIIRAFKEENTGSLGKLKVVYQANENKISVYSAVNRCTLIVNGKMEFVYRKTRDLSVPNRYNTMVLDGEKSIAVEFVVGDVFAKLYYDGNLVAKKFIVLGG